MLAKPSPIEVTSCGARDPAGDEQSFYDALDRFPEYLFEFSRAVIPLSAFMALYPGLLLNQWIMSWEIAVALAAAIVGLATFKLGLLSGIMPLGEHLGTNLPKCCSTSVIIAILFVLGVTVTFAEPAVAVLVQAGSLTSAARAPLLKDILTGSATVWLVVAIGIGVGLAAVVGAIRLMLVYSVKPFILVSLVPVFLVTWPCSKMPGVEYLLGLAWDCGAITTGPVTVPVILSLGIGLARGARKVSEGQQTPNSSRLTARRTSGWFSPKKLFVHREHLAGRKRLGGLADWSPLNEQLVEEKVPQIPTGNSEDGKVEGFGIVTLASLYPVVTVLLLGVILQKTEGEDPTPPQSASALRLSAVLAGSASVWEESPGKEIAAGFRSMAPLVLFLMMCQGIFLRRRYPLKHTSIVVRGIIAAYVGLVIFSIGLNHGLVKLGDAAGNCLAEALVRYPQKLSCISLGHLVILLFGFLMGAGATLAEPALNAMGETVERMSHGQLRKVTIVFSVALGVGTGVVLGITTIMFDLPLVPILTIGYAIAVWLTLYNNEVGTLVAWDSAGVTTGPVTVPLVMSMGLGMARAVNAPTGFGILSCASVCPIVSVLLASTLKL